MNTTARTTRTRWIVALAALAASTSCGKHEKPTFTYMPDMAYSPAYKAQEEGAMRLPVKGTIPRGYERYPYSKTDNATVATGIRNTLPRSSKVMYRGQNQYNTYCLVCHGPNGEGDGSIVPKFPRPPSLQSDKVRGYQDGNIFHIITAGQNLMPSYSSQISVEDRWAIVHYIRALQRAKNPKAEDLRIAEEMDAR